MFDSLDLLKPFRKTKEAIVNTVTAAAFDGFFNMFANSAKDLQLAPVYACIRIISQTIATSPIKLLQETKDGRENQTKHKLVKLMRQPTEYMTYFNWVQFMGLNLAARGNAFAMIVRDVNYEVSELIPLKYESVGVMEIINSNKYFYQINHNGKILRLWPEDVLHFKIMSDDGIRGMNPIETHRATLDNTSKETTYNTAFYTQAVNISGVIESPKPLNSNSVEEIRTSFGANNGGVDNTGKTAVLSDGKTYKQLKLLSPMDANYIESAKLSRADIGVIFGVPLNKLGDLSQATFSNLSEMNRDFYKSTMLAYYICMSQEMDLKLLTEQEKDNGYSFEFDVDILLALSKKERYEIYEIGIRSTLIVPNEARAEEGLSRIEGLDEPFQQSGVMTISQADENFKNENKQTEVKELTNGNKDINDIKSQIGRLTQLVSHLQDNFNKKGDNDE